MTKHVWLTRGALLFVLGMLVLAVAGGPLAVGQQNGPPSNGAATDTGDKLARDFKFDQGPFAVDRQRSNEARIMAALEEPTDLDFTDQPLEEVIEFLKDRHGIEIQLDKRALEDAGQGSDTPITRNLKGRTLASTLDLVLGEADLTFVIHDEVLLVTTKQEAENLLTVKVYPVSDVVKPAGDGPHAGHAQPADYKLLAEVIRTHFEPPSWHGGCSHGPGTISQYPNCGVLVVAQTWHVHRKIEQFLADLREARKAETARN